MGPAEIDRHINDANSTWLARSAVKWTLDLGIHTGVGVTVRRPGRAERRHGAVDYDPPEVQRSIPGR